MNKAELKLLREIIHYVAHHNKNAWWELKRQIWESGYQATYPLVGEFRSSAERQIEKLPEKEKSALHNEYML